MPLHWTFEGDGTWTAFSDYGDDTQAFSYVIAVCDDGTFDVSDSDHELIGPRKVECLPSLVAAKAWCDANDEKLAKGEPS